MKLGFEPIYVVFFILKQFDQQIPAAVIFVFHGNLNGGIVLFDG